MPRSRRQRALRALLCLSATLVLLYLSLIAAPMWLTRWRFTRLLADFQSIYPTQSTWSDAQRLMKRWGRFGHYDGTCTAQACTYQITITDPYYLFRRSLDDTYEKPSRFHPVVLAADHLGLRDARFDLSFIVRNGIITRTSTGIGLDVPPYAYGGWYEETLILGTQARSRLRLNSLNPHDTIMGNDEQLDDHPDWKVGRPGGCSICEFAELAYTPKLPHADMVRFTSYDLSCVTRLHPCTELGDVLPAARDWHLYDRNAPRTAPNFTCHTDPRALGRDAETIVEVDALSSRPEVDQEPDQKPLTYEIAQTRLIRTLKGIVKGEPGAHILITPYVGSTYGDDLEAPEHLIPHHRYFVLLDEAEVSEGSHIAPQRCGVLEDTPDNLRALSLGIAEDRQFPDE